MELGEEGGVGGYRHGAPTELGKDWRYQLQRFRS